MIEITFGYRFAYFKPNDQEDPLTRGIANLMGKGIFCCWICWLRKYLTTFCPFYQELSDKHVTTLRRLIYSCEKIYLAEEIANELFWRTFFCLYVIALIIDAFCGIL